LVRVVARVSLAILAGAGAGLAALALGVAGLVAIGALSWNGAIFGLYGLCVLTGAVAGAVARRLTPAEPSLTSFGAWGLWGAALVALLLWTGPGEMDRPTFLTITLFLGLVGAFFGRAPWRDGG
jgi:hypothetical protein